MDLVVHFHTFGCIRNGMFITRISKVSNPMFLKDFGSNSLVGVQYKVLVKILVDRLAKVVESIVSVDYKLVNKGRQERSLNS